MTTLARLLICAVLLGASCVTTAQNSPGEMPGESAIPDRTIYGSPGHAIGQVAAFVYDGRGIRVTHVVIVHDVNTGAEMRLTVVPWDVLLASRQGERIVLDEGRLGSSPHVTREEINSPSTAWRARADRYWRSLKPA
jgi:hypothetical protein